VNSRSQGVAWHPGSLADVLGRLESSAAGLGTREAKLRLEQFGPNALQVSPPVSAWQILLDQLKSIVVALLFVASILALALGDRLEAVAILAVLAINTTLGFVVELRARRAMEALLSLEVTHATALRDGRQVELDARELVPGDVILLDAGMAVPADARLLEASELRVNEAALTGESAPVQKDAHARVDADMPVADRINMVYKTAAVVSGGAHAVVVATGMNTEVGRIGRMTAELRDEKTPLEERLDTLGRRLVWLTIAIAGLVLLLGVLRGYAALLMVEAAIALAIAAVPEGLPAVATITLGLGLRRMARRNALIRRLPAVEALGSATTICTDKTGTLTAGQMAVTRIWLADFETDVTGDGYAPGGEFLRDGQAIKPEAHSALLEALRIATLANRARVESEPEGWTVYGDPTEAALLVAGRKAGLERETLLASWPELKLYPFSSDRRYMATTHRTPAGEVRTLLKGDPTKVLERCTRVLVSAGERPADEAQRARLDAANQQLASQGLRVLALAYCAGDEPEADLTFVALAGIIDPPVPGVKETIERFRDAGIRTVMITGDQRPTAEAIARDLGLMRDGDLTLDGRALRGLDANGLSDIAGRVGAFSRVSPEDKLRIVTALQERSEIVAMLGDGVNDAAALKKAAIGVAMGVRGTDVAREAADVVLTDDRFETVGAAVEEGRVIYDNIRKFVYYLFSCNLAEVLVLMLATLAGLPLPLAPLQILWLNLVTDTFPALALALEPADPDVMRRPPRSPQAALLSRAFLLRVTASAAVITACALAAWLWALRTSPDQAMTVCFMTLALAQIFHLGNARSTLAVVSPSRIFANPAAIAAVVLSAGLQLATVTSPGLRLVLDTAPLTGRHWLVIAGFSLVPALVGQLAKLWRNRRVSAS